MVKKVVVKLKDRSCKFCATDDENGFTFAIGSNVKIDNVLLIDKQLNIIETAPAVHSLYIAPMELK